MVFKDNNKKFEENCEDRFVENCPSSKNRDLNIFEDIDLNSLNGEMNAIKKVIADNSIDLTENEKIKLQNELELISNVLNIKLQSNNFTENNNKISNEYENEISVVDSGVGLVLDDDGQDVVDSGVGLVLDDDGQDVVDSDDDTNSNFSVDDLVLDDNEHNVVDSNNNILEDENNILDDNLIFDENVNKEFVGDEFLNNNSNENSDSIQDIDANISVVDALDDLIEDYSDEIAIKVENVSMDFKVSKDKIDTFKEFFIRTIKRNKSPVKTVHALKNISFEITKGDRVGIIGFNGAGKSTLLKLLSQVYYPTEGTIETKGKIAPLLELGAGFDNNYTGKDNIFLNGAFLGYSEEFLKEKYDEIIEFSELGDAINYHVKTYSSGMWAKLAFSIATIVEPDILILDEILSVGDIRFRRKSADKIKSLINSGITVLLVSHTVSQIRDLCNKAIWIDEGELRMMGDVNEVCDEYVKASINATSDQLENLDLN
ncbi:MAG: ABC transporter ATP-binding protein [Methanobrevibacter sp.]|nr:ABC transporter ATP-binding protein [Methanobrevibacter sp.]